MPKVTQSLPIEGMHCASCASVIKRTLSKIKGVESCEVSYGTEKAQVVYDDQDTSVVGMNHEIKKLGYTLLDPSAELGHSREVSASGLPHEGHDMSAVSSDAEAKSRKLAELKKLESHVHIVTPFVVFSILVMLWEFGAIFKIFPEMPQIVKTFIHHLLPLMATYTLFVVGKVYLQGVVRFIKHRVANMDTLVGIGTLVAFTYSFILSAFEVSLAPYLDTSVTYYDVTIVVIGFITLGKFLEARSKLRTGEAIEKLLSLQAKNAVVLRNGEQVEVPIEQVVVGDILVIKPGQKIAVDGEITKGSTSIDESMITGESIPVDKQVGEKVIGATINKHGSILVKATQVGSNTVLSQIIKMVEAAQGSKAPIERLADQISAVFVPVVLVISILVLIAWLGIGSQFMPFSQALTLGIVSFVGILVIACPCAMGLATPMAVIVGVGKSAQHGILIKNAESLEKLAQVNTVVLDKTGTVTKGTPEVTDIKSVSDLTEDESLRILASLEYHSEHPLAQAVVEMAKSKKLSLKSVESFKALEGKGLEGEVDTHKYFAGNLKLAQDLSLEANDEIIKQFTSQGKTPILLMTAHEIIAYVFLADTIKPDTASAIKKLHQLGIKVSMLTGDNQRTANHIAAQVGIDNVIAEVLPADKALRVAQLQQSGRVVAMVGDGINDAPALVTSDVGIAMGTGTDVAIESAGITILGGHLAKLPQSIILSRATMRTVKQNLFWAFFYNIVGIPIAAGVLYPFFGIMLSPALAGAAMAFSSVSVVLNALHLKKLNL